MNAATIWTIGHSTHTAEEFRRMLQAFEIEVLADIRSFPGSRRYPHFNKEVLAVSLPVSGIDYIHLKDLGGRRKPNPGSIHTGWRVDAFRAYADYMDTASFLASIEILQELAMKKRVAYMCSEAVWWSCHRALVSDYLKVRSWKVMHIMSMTKAEEHPYTKPARIINGTLSYRRDDPMLDLE